MTIIAFQSGLTMADDFALRQRAVVTAGTASNRLRMVDRGSSNRFPSCRRHTVTSLALIAAGNVQSILAANG